MIGLFFLLCAVPGTASAESPFVRFPSLHPDGTQIAFCFQGDIWTVPVAGGEARRLTIHEGYDSLPMWSGDGTKIAFSSNRYGNDDIFVMPAAGGNPERVTYYSSGDLLSQWATDNTLLFTSSRIANGVEWDSEIFSVPATGGTPRHPLASLGYTPAMSPDKRFIAFVKGDCTTDNEDYHGSANTNIWLYDTKTGTYSALTDYDGNDFSPRWGDNRTLYYISSQSKRYNVFALTLDESGKVTGNSQLTAFTDFGVRYFNVSANGRVLVMEQGTSIYSMNVTDKKTTPVPITIGADYRFDPQEQKTFTEKATGYAVSPNGKLTALVVRGEVFVKENNKDKSRAVNLSNHPYRDQQPVWLNDTALIFCSDRAGQEDLYLVTSADEKQNDIFKSLKHRIQPITHSELPETNPLMSPDGKKIAFLRGLGQLVVADISATGVLGTEKVLLNGWASPRDVCWSPDSQWLAYAMEDLDFNMDVFIQAADNSKAPVNVSMHPRPDQNPQWSPDGSKLGFISKRNYGSDDIWFVWLKKEDWEKTKLDWEETEEEPETPATDPKATDKPAKTEQAKKDQHKDNKEKEKIKPVIIDFENIHERLVQVTSLRGDEGNLVFSKDGKIVYYTAKDPAAKEQDMYSCKWDGTEAKAVTTGGLNPTRVTLDKAGSYLYMVMPVGKLARIETKANKMESLPFVAKMMVDYAREKQQIYEEATRTLTYGFYDPGFHGQDWQKLIATYKNMVLKASTERDFRYLFNIMLGQLNASHMGLYIMDRGELQRQRTGLLGIDVEPLPQGVKVSHIVPGSPADRSGSKLAIGDIILSVDGALVTEQLDFNALLTDKANEQVLLEVKDPAGKIREVVIRPASTLQPLLYDEWVKERRHLTDDYSGGKLGYLHIQEMGWESFERFERELTAAGYGKEGIVIDVRYNGGGWTTDYLMAVLNVKQHAYTVPRGAANNLAAEHTKFSGHYPYGERLPFAAWTKPAITICNSCSYSNAEIFSHAFKTLGLGKLVGEPTFGAVISTDEKDLIDGSQVRLPYRAWYVKATGKNMEHGPAVPDFIVANPPDARAKDKDPQLQKAVEELLKEIQSKK